MWPIKPFYLILAMQKRLRVKLTLPTHPDAILPFFNVQ